MLVHTESGDTYTADDVAEWTSAAGFAPGRFVAPNAYTRLWLAHKLAHKNQA
jgi:predicted urease superfamily metal-dependent hydrolase